MNFFNLFRRGGSAPVARDRLQILLAHERSTPPASATSDLLDILRQEILAAVTRHVDIDPAGVSVKMNRGRKISTLEVEIEIPDTVGVRSSRGRRKRSLLAVHRPA
ncbi:MAG TPA: cell division topological specificity factor MinE [Pseudolabrys sp.]|nr:cell division topological specificity factor MinE [Pseudolabrys sp.]